MSAGRSYEVVVKGTVGAAIANALAPLTVVSQNGETTITADPLDGAMLHSVLRRLDAFGLELIAVRSSVVDAG
jgi:hypothetical protein